MQEWANFVSGVDNNEIQPLAVAGLVEQIKPHIPALPELQRDQIAEALEILQAEISSGAADQSKLRAALSDMKAITEGAAVNLVAVGIGGMVSQLLSD